MAKEKKDTLKKADASADEATKTKKAKKSEKKSKKDDGKKGNAVVKWFKDLKIEFKKVTWPSKHTVFVNTGIVLGTIVVSSLFIGLLDTGMLKLVELLLGLSQA
jgi:preprotein translocase subunit SecE